MARLGVVFVALVAAACSSDDPQVAPAGVAAPNEPDPGESGPGESVPEGPRHEPETTPTAPELELRDVSLVVSMPNGMPASQVPVRFLDTALVPRSSLLRATGGEPDAEKLLEVLGIEKLTDSAGQVTFSSSGGPLLASASSGQLYVMKPFAPLALDAPPLELELAIEPSVRARAVSEQGVPIPGIPIALAMELPTTGGGSRWVNLAIRETSGRDGQVKFRDARGGVQSSGGERPIRFGLRAAIPGLMDPGPVIFDPSSPPAEAIELKIPPLSTIVVEVVYPSGERRDIDADVIVEEERPASADARELAVSAVGSRLRARLRAGRATLTAIVPGTLLRVTIQPLDGTPAFDGVGHSARVAGDVAIISVSMD